MDNRLKKLTIASIAAISICTPFVVKFEGDKPVGYADPVGIPTAGAGHTRPDVVIGKWYDDATRRRWLQDDLSDAAATVERCAPATIDIYQRAAFVSFAYNIGPGKKASKTGFASSSPEKHRPISDGPERETKPDPARRFCPGQKPAERYCPGWLRAARQNTNCA